MKRLLGMTSSEAEKLSAGELLEAIRLSEGRILAAECVCSTAALLNDVSNAETAAAMSADLLILNIFDVDKPYVAGLPEGKPEDTIRLLKKLTGRKIGINLEPVEPGTGNKELWAMTPGRMATAANARKAKELGVDFIVITGNPGNMVTNTAITSSLKAIREELQDEIILASGKMHASGSLKEAGENIVSRDEILSFIEAGSDIILLPAPGTVPGISPEFIREMVSYVHRFDKLTMTCIGTSQEGSDADTIRQIALWSKMSGTDIHHIGDSGYVGMALPENIMTYSIAIRGVRHTYHRMGQSINR